MEFEKLNFYFVSGRKCNKPHATHWFSEAIKEGLTEKEFDCLYRVMASPAIPIILDAYNIHKLSSEICIDWLYQVVEKEKFNIKRLQGESGRFYNVIKQLFKVKHRMMNNFDDFNNLLDSDEKHYWIK